MRYSLELPTTRVDRPDEFLTVEAITEIVHAAVAAGFDAVNVTDHPAPDAVWLDRGGHHALDPFVALAVAAGADPGIRLHTNIYVAAYRNPFLGAKSVHSLHALSGERLILGVAAGYLAPEFDALGIDFTRRGALLDEALAVLDEVFTGADVAWTGDGFEARGVRLRPVLGARPPVWIGGNSPAAMRRAARFDGWAPFHTGGFARATRTTPIESPDDLRRGVRQVLGELERAGREAPFDVCWSEAYVNDQSNSAAERLHRARELEAAGVTWLTATIGASSRRELIERVAGFGGDIIAPA